MLKHLATRDIFRIFTVLEHVSTSVKIKVMSESKERANFLYELNRLIDNHHHSLYLIDGVFDGVKIIKKSIHEFENNNNKLK